MRTLIRCLTTAIALATVVQCAAADLDDVPARAGKTVLHPGNRVELLLDGPEAFERRLDLVRSAEHHLLISTFIWRRDDYGLRFFDAVVERMREVEHDGGHLEVLVILDGTTSLASNDPRGSLKKRLKKAGVTVRLFNPIRWGLTSVYGARLHDKVLIADGRRAVFGGRNYSDHYFVDSGHSVWFDADVFLEGPAVEDLQMNWLKSWAVLERMRHLNRFLRSPEKTLREIRTFWRTGFFPDGSSPLQCWADRSWFPLLDAAGRVDAAILYDNPLIWDRAPTVDVVVELVRRAQTEVDLVTPFPNFPPDLATALIDAAERGVRVRVLTNSEQTAVRDGIHWRALLPSIVDLGDGGVEVWGWTGGRNADGESPRGCDSPKDLFSGIHAKLFQVDGRIAVVTASNFNVRSNWYNTEAGLLIADAAEALEVRRTVDRMVGVQPLDLQCDDGGLLEIERPSELFDQRRRERIRVELGSDAPRLEAYGPAF